MTAMDARLRELAEAARGFMPPDEGVALYDAAVTTPCSSSTKVERITPRTVLPYRLFSPYAP